MRIKTGEKKKKHSEKGGENGCTDVF